VIPRFEGDGERFAANPLMASTAEQAEMAQRLRSALL